MSSVIDQFLLKTLTKSGTHSQGIGAGRIVKESELSIFVPVMTLERFSELTGIPPGVLRGNCDRGHIPTHVVGRRRVVNVSLLNRQLLEKEECFIA